MRQFGNCTPSDPSVNLTYHGFRRRQLAASVRVPGPEIVMDDPDKKDDLTLLTRWKFRLEQRIDYQIKFYLEKGQTVDLGTEGDK